MKTTERKITGIIRAVQERRIKNTRYYEIGVQITDHGDLLNFNISPVGLSDYMNEYNVMTISGLLDTTITLTKDGKQPIQMEANYGE